MAVDYRRRILVRMNTSKYTSNHSHTFASELRLGVDIGRVIIAGDGPDTSFVGGSDEDALRTPEIAGATEALTRLHRALGGRVWLVSKCGARVQERTRRWLAHRRFFETTRIDPANLFFCHTRPEKAPICQKLEITCFVDDRSDVLASMNGIVPHRLWFGASDAHGSHVTPVAGWGEAEAEILRLQSRADISRGREA
jgi:hypothetical protein